MTLPTIPPMRPEPARDRWGRYLLPDPVTTVPRGWTRATTLASTLSDQYAISKWRQRKVAEGLAKRPVLLSDVPALALYANSDDWRAAKEAKADLDALCDEAAKAAGADAGSDVGTLLHTCTEYADAGRRDEIEHLLTDSLRADLDAYTATMDAAGIRRPSVYIERIVINTAVDSAGTFDRLLVMPDGRLVVGDLKTQQSVDFGWLSIALQLAEYAWAEYMIDVDTGAPVPMPGDLDRSVGLVMHLAAGSGRCDLYEVDLAEGWRAAQLAHEVREFRGRSKALGRPYLAAVPAPVVDEAEARRAFLLSLVNSAQHPDALVGLWADLDGRGEWTPELTSAAQQRKAQLLRVAA